MLLMLSEYLARFHSAFRVFQYLTLRGILAAMTALAIALLIGPAMIGWLSRYQIGQRVRSDGPQTHLTKAGTPTMGGLLILSATFVSTLLWARWDNGYVWLVLFVTTGFGLIGFADDYAKVKRQNVDGVSGRIRLAAGFAIALLAGAWAMYLHPGDLTGMLAFPVFKGLLLDLGLLFLPFAMLVIVGAANAVNLTDGLDGLAIMPVMIAAAALGVIAYVVGRADFSTYLDVHYVPGTGEITVFVAALIGGGLGFLWYNAPPAAVFMGDTGSLALGGALGAIAVAAHHEIVLAIVGGLFVLEAASVIIQVFFYKRTGRRVFRMAPIHHHFEQLGWSESQIVVRFWIIAFVLALIGLSTLKVR